MSIEAPGSVDMPGLVQLSANRIHEKTSAQAVLSILIITGRKEEGGRRREEEEEERRVEEE